MSARAARFGLARAVALRAIIALLATGAFLALHASTLADPVWVRFESARAEPSALALRALHGAQGVRRHREAATLRGLLTAPIGAGPFPAVVLLHDCRGVKDNQRSLAQWLAEQGFVTLLVDSFYSRNAINVCTHHPDDYAQQAIGGRVFDAFGALDYLRRDPRVDADRVAVVAWGHSAAISAIAHSGPARLVSGRFSAAVAISPTCSLRGDRLDAPLLVVVAERDAPQRASRCARFVRSLSEHNDARPASLLSLAGARYGFDDPSLAPAERFLAAAFDPWQAPRRGLVLDYDREAHQRSIERITAFLVRHLAPSDSVGLAFDAYPRAPWVADPKQPGPDWPPVGASLFDQLVAHWGGRHAEPIPFPVARLVERIADVAGHDEAGRSGVKVTLIPFGRSLQRHAAAPEFFRYPRVVMALDGEPDSDAIAALPWLKDRLFIGYQEKAGVLEVISFNRHAGRFEFQVVENYRAGATPEVRYANRTLCVSCHHHHAPLFPRAGWDETSQDMAVARRIRGARSDLYDLEPFLLSESAALIDNATDRASELLLWQTLWRDGCGASVAEQVACRGAITLAALQYRLSGSNGFDATAQPFKDDVLRPLGEAFKTRWPHGLNMASPDLPNREPLKDARPTELSAPQDPLTPRPPVHLAAGAVPQIAVALVHGVAESLPLALVERLDRALMSKPSLISALELGCELTERGHASAGSEITLRCGQPGSAEILLRMTTRNGRILSGQVAALRLPGQPAQQRLVVTERSTGQDAESNRTLELAFRQRTVPLSVRRADGRRLAGALLRWPANDDAGRRTPLARFYSSTLELHYAKESQPLVDGVRRAIAVSGDSAWTLSRFDGAHLVASVLEALDDGPIAVCCATEPTRPGPRSATVGTTTSRHMAAANPSTTVAAAPVQHFRRACGRCHGADTRMPPGFLNGNDESALRALRHCAERIYLRLSMWQLEPAERPKSAMPPASAVGHTLDALPIAELRSFAAGWLTEERGHSASLAALLMRGYDDAPPCLAER